MIDSEEMIARGRARRVGVILCGYIRSVNPLIFSQAGLPVFPATAEDAMQRGMMGYGNARYVPGAGPIYY